MVALYKSLLNGEIEKEKSTREMLTDEDGFLT